ncbi:DNA helicase [Melia azedarach]|uniref:DNA helicase n=1 Tax=Melia azedarach TaxID=155640 RepID=A0ACC1Y728_MELAZ|nr:DNA helicase [Melia azedarach]
MAFVALMNLPENSRYSKHYESSIALPLAILSRFGMVYVMIDDPYDQNNYHIGHHIVRVDQKHEDALAPAFTTAQLKRSLHTVKL